MSAGCTAAITLQVMSCFPARVRIALSWSSTLQILHEGLEVVLHQSVQQKCELFVWFCPSITTELGDALDIEKNVKSPNISDLIPDLKKTEH